MSKGIQPVLNHHSKKKKKRRGGGRNPALFEHPLNGLRAPTSQTEAYSHARMLPPTHTQSRPLIPPCPHTNTLSEHTRTCPDNSCFSVAHSHRQTMSSSPLTVHPSPALRSLHFSSHQLCSSPFLLCCGSCDRGIPSLLTPPMG